MKYIKALFSAEFNEKKLWHNLAFFAVLLLCILICLSAWPNVDDPVKYPIDTAEGKNWWVQQFDAFEKGQIHLDLPENHELGLLDNPYDPAERVGIKYPWDRAYYEGKFYSYFGIAPILTVYYPSYILTGELPSVSSACLIAAVIAMLFLGLAYREFVIRFCKGASLLLMLILFIGVAFSSGIFIGICWADSYYLAVISAIEWSMIFMFLGLRAMRAVKTWSRAVLLSLSAIALTMTVWSRPTVAVICLAVLPVFVEYAVRGGKADIKGKIISISSFAVTLAAGAGVVMWYNAARFGSPFDFGSSYQLTVSDISQNRLEPYMFGDSLYHFFFRTAEPIMEFPFFKPKYIGPSYDRFFYSAKAVGAFAFGVPAAVLAAPFACRTKKDPAKTATLLGGIVLCLAIAFFDYCYAGIDMRYIIDILPLLSLVGAAVLLNLNAEAHGQSSVRLQGVIGAVSVILCIFAVLMAISCTRLNPGSYIFGITE